MPKTGRGASQDPGRWPQWGRTGNGDCVCLGMKTRWTCDRDLPGRHVWPCPVVQDKWDWGEGGVAGLRVH